MQRNEKCPGPLKHEALNTIKRDSDYINFFGLGYITRREALKTVAIAIVIVGVFFAIVFGTSFGYGIYRGWWTWPL